MLAIQIVANFMMLLALVPLVASVPQVGSVRLKFGNAASFYCNPYCSKDKPCCNGGGGTVTPPIPVPGSGVQPTPCAQGGKSCCCCCTPDGSGTPSGYVTVPAPGGYVTPSSGGGSYVVPPSGGGSGSYVVPPSGGNGGYVPPGSYVPPQNGNYPQPGGNWPQPVPRPGGVYPPSGGNYIQPVYPGPYYTTLYPNQPTPYPPQHDQYPVVPYNSATSTTVYIGLALSIITALCLQS